MENGQTGNADSSPEAPSYPPAMLSPLVDDATGIVKLVNAQRSFEAHGTSIPALRRVTATIARGSMSALIGPPSSGKSTLLAAIAGRERLSSGHISVDSHPISALGHNDIEDLRGKLIGYVSRHDSLIPALTVADNISLYADMQEHKIDQRRYHNLTRAFGLVDLLEKLPSDLSLQQRFEVSVVRELILDPPLLLIDDPGTDPSSPALQRLMNFLAGDNAVSARTVIYATDLAALSSYASHVYFMAQGRIVAQMTDPTSSAVAAVMPQLDNWDPAKAFRKVKEYMSLSDQQKIWGQEGEAGTGQLVNALKQPANDKPSESVAEGTWPHMPENLRERLQNISFTAEKTDDREPITPQAKAASEADKLVNKAFDFGGMDLSSLAALIPPAGSIMPSDFDAIDAALARELGEASELKEDTDDEKDLTVSDNRDSPELLSSDDSEDKQEKGNTTPRHVNKNTGDKLDNEDTTPPHVNKDPDNGAARQEETTAPVDASAEENDSSHEDSTPEDETITLPSITSQRLEIRHIAPSDGDTPRTPELYEEQKDMNDERLHDPLAQTEPIDPSEPLIALPPMKLDERGKAKARREAQARHELAARVESDFGPRSVEVPDLQKLHDTAEEKPDKSATHQSPSTSIIEERTSTTSNIALPADIIIEAVEEKDDNGKNVDEILSDETKTSHGSRDTSTHSHSDGKESGDNGLSDDDALHHDEEIDGSSLSAINQEIVRMKARLRTMAEQAERRLNTLESARRYEHEQHSDHNNASATHVQSFESSPSANIVHDKTFENDNSDDETGRFQRFREDDDHRWAHLMSIWAVQGLPTQDQARAEAEARKITTAKAAPHNTPQAKPNPVDRRLQLIEMMQRANELLVESDQELKQVREELGDSSKG